MENATIRPVIERLEQVFDTFNKHFYNNELERPVITVAQDTTSGAYGWFTTWRAWQEEGSEGYYEINICAETLDRPFHETVGTLLHEMAHLYARMNNIKDTSRGGTYHNKRFKEIAEAHGLIIENTQKYGWTKTSLSDSTKEFVDSMNFEGFTLRRTPMAKLASGKKSSSKKYVCPHCGQSVRATKEIRILCGECSTEDELVLMELED